MIDLDALRSASDGRMGLVLERLGAKVHGSEAKGRASCPVHQGDSLNTMFGDKVATCFSGCDEDGTGKTRDALALVADCHGWNLRDRDDLTRAAEELAGILGARLDDGSSSRPAPRRASPAPRPDVRPARDAEGLWRLLAAQDEAGEAYLAGRRILPDPLVSGVLKFNVGSSGDEWLDARSRDGYRCSFAVRRPDATVASIVTRYVLPGEPPAQYKKAPGLPRLSTAGAAIARPEIALLATGDSEFERDEVAIVEGPTDWLAATKAFDLSSGNALTPPVWTLGAIGASNAAGVLAAFAPVVRGRTVHVALDADPAGDKHVDATVAAAWAAGARRVTRMVPPGGGKDFADEVPE